MAFAARTRAKVARTSDVIPRVSSLELFLRIAIGCAAAGLSILFFVTALKRSRYPYELEALEGYMVVSLRRVMYGQTLYPAPNIHFVPYMYPPGYFYIAGWLGRQLGTGATFLTLRLTSMLATLGAFGFIYLLVWKEAKRHLAALAAVGVYAACYNVSAGWFDVGRVDSVYVLLVLAAIFATRHWHPAVAALFWLLAFTTKQSILPFAALMMCFHWERRLRTLLGLAVLGSGAIAIVKILDLQTSSWFSFYVFEVPRANAELHFRAGLGLLPRDILVPLGPACIVILAAILFTPPNWRSIGARFYLISGSLILLCGFIRMHQGSNINSVMPAYALLATVSGICFARIDRWLEFQPLTPRNSGAVLLLSTMLVQLVSGIYHPGIYWPSPEKQAAVETLIHQAKEQAGDVYVVRHPYYGILAGKSEYADQVSLHDTLVALDPPVRQQLQTEMGGMFVNHVFAGVFFDGADSAAEFNTLMNLDPQWEKWYPVRMHAPNTDATTAGTWLVLRCPLPAIEYGSISAPLLPPAIEGCAPGKQK